MAGRFSLTVQVCRRFTKALSTLLRREVEVVVPDALMPVHASQWWRILTVKPVDVIFMTDKLNRLFPRIFPFTVCVPYVLDAHARFDATVRTYKYYVITAKMPFNRQYRCRLFQTPDLNGMNEAARTLFEYTDFTSFRSKLHTDVKTNNCKIMHAALDAGR